MLRLCSCLRALLRILLSADFVFGIILSNAKFQSGNPTEMTAIVKVPPPKEVFQ